MVRGTQGQIRSPHTQPPLPEFVERLGRCHLVNQMKIDEKNCGRIGFRNNDVRFPDFVLERLRLH